MGRALIIGCGGVAGVVIHKCCQNSEVFSEICIASRTKSKCDAVKENLRERQKQKSPRQRLMPTMFLSLLHLSKIISLILL